MSNIKLPFWCLSGIASTYPEPVDKRAFIEEQMYDYNYDCPLPATYYWPEEAMEKDDQIGPVHNLPGDHLKHK